MAIWAASANVEISNVVGLSPVTDLQRLKEFDKVKVDESIYGLEGKSHHIASLHIFVKIGSADDRVGTHETLRLVEAITAAGGGKPVDLTLAVTSESGHVSAEHDRAAQRIIDEFKGVSTNGNSPLPPK